MEQIIDRNQQLRFAIIHAASSLNNMVQEMMKKQLELKRITKTAALLFSSGFASPSTNASVIMKCQNAQHEDGGWVAIVDTMWNAYFLSLCCNNYNIIENAHKYLVANQGKTQIWGRSRRDIERIPVSGMMLYLFPCLASEERLHSLENLWISEQGSLTYKASYTLMAFSKNNYMSKRSNLINDTVQWLIDNQRDDGSFAPWKSHPVSSDTYCTAIALLGMMSYRELVPVDKLQRAVAWLLDTQLHSGIWPYHEIDDGTSWALYALSEFQKTKNSL